VSRKALQTEEKEILDALECTMKSVEALIAGQLGAGLQAAKAKGHSAVY